MLILSVVTLHVDAKANPDCSVYMYCGSDTTTFSGYKLYYLMLREGVYWIPRIAFVAKNCDKCEPRVDSCISIQRGAMYMLCLENKEPPKDLVPITIVDNLNEDTILISLYSPYVCVDSVNILRYGQPEFMEFIRGHVNFGLEGQQCFPYYVILNVCGENLLVPKKHVPASSR